MVLYVKRCLLGDECGFSKDGQKDSQIEGGSPKPKTGVKTIGLLHVPPEQNDGEPEQQLQRRN